MRGIPEEAVIRPASDLLLPADTRCAHWVSMIGRGLLASQQFDLLADECGGVADFLDEQAQLPGRDAKRVGPRFDLDHAGQIDLGSVRLFRFGQMVHDRSPRSKSFSI